MFTHNIYNCTGQWPFSVTQLSVVWNKGLYKNTVDHVENMGAAILCFNFSVRMWMQSLCLVHNHFFFFSLSLSFKKGRHFPGSRDRTLDVVFTDPVQGKILISALIRGDCNINSAYIGWLSVHSGVAHLLAGTLL